MKNNYLNRTVEILWFLLIFLLPFTSLPIASRLLRSEMVASPSIIFLLLLLPFILFFSRNNKFPNNKFFVPLFIFGSIALISSLLSFYLPIPIQKQFSIESNIFEGLVTLFIGISFFFVSVLLTQSDGLRTRTLRIISYSFVPLLIWCLLQFIFGQLLREYPDWMISIQKLLTTSGSLYRNRITGFAFEPSWLAHQMNMFFIPIWAGLSFTRQSAFRKIFNIFNLEDIFLFFSIIILFLTKSRVGYITLIFVLFYLLIRIHKLLVRKLGSLQRISSKKVFIKLLPIILLVIYLIVLFGGLFFFSKFDPRMENLLNIEIYRNRNIFSIANEFVFAERILYWQTGWHIFNDFPILGVGLGNSGFFFKDYLPSFAWALDEPRHLIFQANYQGNIKNLWFRLLSETGMFGFLSFSIWLLTIYFISEKLDFMKTSKHQTWGLIGKIGLIALFFEGFSIDSFALPYFWIVLGMVVAKYSSIIKSDYS